MPTVYNLLLGRLYSKIVSIYKYGLEKEAVKPHHTGSAGSSIESNCAETMTKVKVKVKVDVVTESSVYFYPPITEREIDTPLTR